MFLTLKKKRIYKEKKNLNKYLFWGGIILDNFT